MGKRIDLQEALALVKGMLSRKFWNPKHYEPNDWFFPSDLANSPQFKYKCKKLYEVGLLERRGDENDRWGYQYRVKGD